MQVQISLWDNLVQIAETIDIPRLTIGDFNDVINQSIPLIELELRFMQTP